MGIVPPKMDRWIEYWNLPTDTIDLTNAAQDHALLDIVIDNFPDGHNILQVLAMLKCRMVENTNAAVNATDGVQQIQMMRVGVAWTDVITIPTGTFALAATTREQGGMITGDINPAIVAALIDRNDIYNVRWEQSLALQNNLDIFDIQVGLKIFYN